jgi:site-specific DNA-methyltransferase (adenine-specific)
MNQIYFGDNLSILQSMQSETVDLIYIDPPFNTGKVQKHTKIKTIRSEKGSRVGFQGNTYETIELGTKAYQDVFEYTSQELLNSNLDIAHRNSAPDASIYYLEVFLKPRLVEAKRILKPHGSLYFHIDYREVHYCKILLDGIFGRECFRNEIIWAYDYGGRAKSRWPAKHDNILFYVKDPKKYIFNTNKIDREPYMAPGLVGPEKAKAGKLPTDVWWPGLVGAKINKGSSNWYLRGQNATWWQTIVPTNSKERVGYPTQKPRKLLDRIIQASSMKGGVVLDFFAGSGTTGESCLELDRNFILVDNNKAALEIMAQRFTGIKEIEWIKFNPKPYQLNKATHTYNKKVEIPEISKEFIMLAATASSLQEDIENEIDPWENSPFEWILKLPPRKKGKLGGDLIASWLASKGLSIEATKDSSETISINGLRFATKFSTLWANDIYRFQQVRATGFDYVICLGISPFNAHCWVVERQYAISNAKPQHRRGAKVADYWIEVHPKKPEKWIGDCGGTLEQTYRILKTLKKKR